MKRHFIRFAAGFFAGLAFVSFLLTCAIYTIGDHPIAFLHALILCVCCVLLLAVLLPFVVKYE